MKKIVFCIVLITVAKFSFGQEEILRRVNSMGGNKSGNNGRKDTIGFEHRDDAKDSINITYRFLDSTNRNRIDSSVNDFDKYYSVPSNYQYLGNNGAAAFPLIFKPNLQIGWDHGFHAYDVYKFTLEETKLYRTTRPFSMLGYQLASGKEQMIKVMHTQNPTSTINIGLDYRLINAPGFFITQNTNHNNIRLFSTYQGKRKRYAATLVLINNTIRASENGGITNDSSLKDPNKKERYSIDVNMGNAANYSPNPFLTTINTGNTYKEFTAFFRHHYDIGLKDSIVVNDSLTEYLFYPKLRLQHTINYSTYKYSWFDAAADSLLYKNWYNLDLSLPTDTFSIGEKWSVLSNDFSLIQYPDKKNAAQFFLVGATYQQIVGKLDNGTNNLYNIFAHGEYRNRTRNKKWDMMLQGALYLNGVNSGDYSAYASLSRMLNKKLGNVTIHFKNVNRTPSFIFDPRSTFNLGNNSNVTKKENIISFGANARNPFVDISFTNTIITNYSYFTNYYTTDQYSKIINIIQASASKKMKLSKKINLYSDITLQQVDKNSPVRMPFFFTRNRLSYEGNFYKNLNLSTGLEIRYYSTYKANNYSPIGGQFVPQDSINIKNIPDVSAFLHFRIKGFTAYIRGENLNTVSFKNGFDFTNNNFAAPHYPTQGFMLRFGIQWWFVN